MISAQETDWNNVVDCEITHFKRLAAVSAEIPVCFQQSRSHSARRGSASNLSRILPAPKPRKVNDEVHWTGKARMNKA
jgi:hypothetical protein